MAESNKRTQKRENLLFYLRVFNSSDKEYVGRVVDMSPQGLMLVVGYDVREGTVFDLTVELPEDLAGCSEFNVTVQCKWCKPDINKDYYVAGFIMTAMKSGTETAITALLEQYSFSLSSE